MGDMAREKRRRPAWLVGLILAVVVFAIVLLVFNLLGYGDDPSLGAIAVQGRTAATFGP